MKNKNAISKNKIGILSMMMITAVTLLFMASPTSIYAQESEAASAESTSREPIAIINEIRTLLTQANNQYAGQDFVGAEASVQTAYLDHYEYLEGPLAALDPELMEATEILIRETLIGAIQDRAPLTEVQSLINNVNTNLDQAEVLFQQQP
ncbi:hypothetical protein [Candidatus Nitrosocosmicus franklandus]|uniref:Uncharacterized protein n=1 Tax=Candidatus Nitrosocosmicus franklandianus TaxID=1798806 RepID=A0A484IAL3_9ARCH|nr:hypothetical protein [Candidatus Nitrosocosmicus franklandus]VFJ14283.1 exported protein of unknown function [Candidatus Nitrosocosmicus franklandus]